MKDLATLRNPNSKYTFLSYLHSQGRLLNFINRGSMMPPRREFADYLSWAADKVQRDGVQVAYAEEVVGINKADAGESLFIVTSRRASDGDIITRLARKYVFRGALLDAKYLANSFQVISSSLQVDHLACPLVFHWRF